MNGVESVTVEPYRRSMRCRALIAMLVLTVTVCTAAPRGEVIKVLPHYLDEKGRASINPSLFDRDAYQAQLRARPERRTGIRFDVHWKARSEVPLTLRLEARGSGERRTRIFTVERTVKAGRFSRWTPLVLTGEPYAELEDLVAWRATLLNGTNVLARESSFLW